MAGLLEERIALYRDRWSLAQLVAWIMARDWQAVTDARTDTSGFFALNDGAEVVRLQYRSDFSERGGNVDDVADEILTACRSGKLQVLGRYKISTRHIKILQADWDNLTMSFSTIASMDVAENNTGLFRLAEWYDLLFDVEEAVNCWPGPTKTTGCVSQPKAHTVSSEKSCEDWLVQLMSQSCSPAQPKSDYFERAKENFGISRRGFDRAWANAINRSGNEAWSKPGRKS